MVLIDFSSRNNGHSMFNTSILKGLISNSKCNLKFYTNESNPKIIEFCKKNKINNLKFKEKSSYLFTVLVAFYKSIVFNKQKKYILLTFDNSLLPMLFIGNFIFLKFKNKEFTIILHNNLETFKNVKWKQKLFNLMLKIYKPKIILLSPFIGKEFRKIFNYDNFEAIFHQNYKDLINDNFLNVIKQEQIIISISSSHSKIFVKEKIDKYFLLNGNQNNLLINYIYQKDFNFSNKNIFKKVNRPDKEFDYLYYIYSSDYMFFPLDESANMRASGVLIDALSLGTSFIAPNVGAFKDINEEFGLGFLYNDYSELPKILNQLEKVVKTKNELFLEKTKIENLLKVLYFE